jgi:D-sedoheptulose 7-phosphate isomerase
MKNAASLIDMMVADSLSVKSKFFSENRVAIVSAAEVIANGFCNGRKVLLFGNGGSAADAQHIAAEFVGRFAVERRPLPALSLSTDTSVLTALSNDYGFESVFARQIRGLAHAGDTAIGISTSGNSPNVLHAVEAARSLGLYTIGLTGETGGKMKGRVEVLFSVPSQYTPRIQETHIMIGHIICDLIDRMLFPENYPQD